jgi:hypothetical protein
MALQSVGLYRSVEERLPVLTGMPSGMLPSFYRAMHPDRQDAVLHDTVSGIHLKLLPLEQNKQSI